MNAESSFWRKSLVVEEGSEHSRVIVVLFSDIQGGDTFCNQELSECGVQLLAQKLFLFGARKLIRVAQTEVLGMLDFHRCYHYYVSSTLTPNPLTHYPKPLSPNH